MKYSWPLLEYSLSPLGYSCNIGQKTFNIHGNPCQHFWHQSSDCIFCCAEQFVCWLFMTLLSCSLLRLRAFFQGEKGNRDLGASWSNAPSLTAVVFDIMNSCLHKLCPQGWRSLKLSCVLVMASWVDHCMVTYYSSWYKAGVMAALSFFSWLIFFFVGPGV